MNNPHARTADAPFSYSVKVGHISANPVTVRIEADESERRGLAKLWGIVAVASLKADLQINKWKKDGVRIKGSVTARVTQSCVVSLDPVEAEIDAVIDQIFVPENSRLARIVTGDSAEMVVDPDGPDLPEMFSGDTIDAGVVVAEFAALSLDPYPRKPGVTFSGHIEDTGESDGKRNPFAALKDWKKDE